MSKHISISNFFPLLGLLDKRAVYDENGRSSIIVGLFNIDSRLVTTNSSFRYVNIADGVLLTEALRYSVKRSNKLFSTKATAYVIDNKESFPPYASHFFYPYVNALYSWQMAPYMLARKRQTSAPFVNVLPFSMESPKGDASKFSVVPAENFEVDAILDILTELEWKYISVVGSLDNENQETVERFTEKAGKRQICIGVTVLIPISPSSQDLKEAVQKLNAANNASVVVLFANPIAIQGLLHSEVHGFNFLSGTRLRASRNEITFQKSTAKGLLLLQHVDTYDEDFTKYFLNLTLSTNYYSWFGEFWSETFQCNIPKIYRSRFGIYRKNYDKNCTGVEKLTKDIVDLEHALIKPVIKAVESIACALNSSEAMRDCIPKYLPHYSTWCGRRIMIKASKYINKGNCGVYKSVTNHPEFQILNFDGTSYSKVGIWHFNDSNKKSTLNLLRQKITWNQEKHAASSCYMKCGIDEVEDRGANNNICCYECKKCKANEIVANNSCTKCLAFHVPDVSRSKCLRLPYVSISSQNEAILLLQCSAILGIVITAGTMGMCVKYRRSRIVKSTGRELSFLMMVAIVMCFSTSIVFFAKPSPIVCAVQQIILSQCLSACYIPLLLKTVRIHRVFQASKKLLRNPSYVSTRSQVIMSCAGIVANLLLGILLLISQPANALQELIEDGKKVAVICGQNPMHTITSLVPCIVLMLLCTYFGYKTRSFPSNFNESFRISITMYISCFLWAIFVPLLYVFQLNRSNVFSTNLTTAGLMITLGYVNFFGLFGATLIQILSKKEIRPELFATGTIQRSMATDDAGTTMFSTEAPKKRVTINLPEIRN